MDVDAALAEVPVNYLPLTDSTDFVTREESVVYNQAGLDLVWNFQTTAGARTQTAVTPTTGGGDYDWTNQGNGDYTIGIPASGGASINNDTEGFGWFSGLATGILSWVGPVVGFRAAALNNALIDGGDNLDVNTVEISGDSGAADNLELDYDGTGYNKSNSTIGTTTTNTDMRGTDSALLAASAPANFGDLAITVTTGRVTVGTNADKTGYDLNADQSAVTIGTTTTNTDMRGTDNALLAASAPTNFGDLAITVTTGKVTVGTNDDKTGYDLNADQSAVTIGTTTTNTDMRGTDNAATEAKQDIAQTDLDTLTDARGEPGQGAPPVSATTNLKIDHIYKQMRNKQDSDGTTEQYYADDASTVDSKRTVSAAGGTVTKGEIVTGP
jgi:hypothetical protein